MERLSKIVGYDKKGRIKPFYHDVAIESYAYDKAGNVVEIKSFGEAGKLISSAYEDTPIIRKVYNQKNQLIEEWYLDENENLRSEFGIYKYTYDETGKVVSEGWYNKNGKKEK